MLSDKELLLLNSFMYLKDSTSKHRYITLGDIVDTYLNNPDMLKSDILSGGFESKKGIERFREILYEIHDKHPDLMNLELGESTNHEDDKLIRGRCFAKYDKNKNIEGHVIAFGGTGGAFVAWHDNFLGLYMNETQGQKKQENLLSH